MGINPLRNIILTALLAAALPLSAQTPEEIEASGQEQAAPGPAPVRDSGARARALAMLRGGASGLLLIPESTNDRVMAFDPNTGNLVDPDFIPADPTNLSTPICAIPGLDGNSILVSDQLEDVVQAYDLDGNYLGIFAPAGGPDTSILDNIRGIAPGPNNTLLVTVGGGANDDAVAQFDSNGNHIGNFVANGAGGLDSPFDIFERASDFLVGGITSDAIHRYDTTGTFLDNFSAIDGFPEQINMTASGNVLVGNFIGSQEGVVEFTPAGAVVGVYDPASLGGYRGAYELPNGNILTTNGGGVHEIDRSGNLVETKIASVSARFIEFLPPAIVCEDVTIQATIGSPIIITGLPGCVVDVFNACDADPSNWVLLVSGVELGSNGTATLAINAAADQCYLATVTGDPTQTLNQPVRTVPALKPLAMVLMLIFLAFAGMFFIRRAKSSPHLS